MGIREAGLDERTTLTRVQPHRLRALILEDLERFPGSGRGDIHRRIGPEIHTKTLARALEALLKDGQIVASGERRWRTYRLSPAKGHPGSEGGGGKDEWWPAARISELPKGHDPDDVLEAVANVSLTQGSRS